MSLRPPESVQKLRNSLHAKAKGSPGYRFYALYDKGVPPDVLAHAYACCKANQGRQGGRPDIRGHRGVRAGTLAGRTPKRAEGQVVPSLGGSVEYGFQTRRETKTLGVRRSRIA